MATNTTNYRFKKPDESDFYDVADQNKNWDLADEALKNLDTPTFEDYTGSTAVPSATDAIDQIKSKGKLGTLLSNIKAAFKGACLIGHIVNNCVTDNAGLPLSAAQGKGLKDLYTQLYSEGGTVSDNLAPTLESLSQPPSEYCTFSQWVANAERCGNEVTLSFNISGRIKEVSTIFLLKTIPEKYRPRANKHISYRTQDGYDMAIFIQTDGQIQLFTGGKAVSGFFLRQVITYPAA